jgi:hypothetical protein
VAYLSATADMPFIVVGKMSRKIHAVMEDPSNLDPAVVACSVQQEVAGSMDSVGRWRYSVSTVAEMIGSGRCGNFRSRLAAGTLGIIGHVEDGADQERLVAKPCRRPEPFVGPREN